MILSYPLKSMQQICRYYCDVIISAMASQITSIASLLFAQPFIQTQIKDNIKAPRHCPLWGNPSVTGGIPSQRASNADNGSIWWRRHDAYIRCAYPCYHVLFV